jgi:Protein of unknown function (DUF4232)
MLRFLLAAALASCAAPATVVPTPTGARTAAPGATSTSIPAPSFTSTPDPAALPKCPATQLRAVAAGTMAADAFIGAIFFSNRGAGACTLRGNPELLLLAKDGSPLDLRLATVSAPNPAWVVLPVSEFQQSASGLVGFGATVPLQWSNYCDDVLAESFRVTLPDAGGALDGTFVDLEGRPIAAYGTARCEDAAGPSTLTVFPFQTPVR